VAGRDRCLIQWHNNRLHRCARRSAQLDARTEDGEFVRAFSGEFFEIGSSSGSKCRLLREELSVNRKEVQRFARGCQFQRQVVGADHMSAIPCRELGARRFRFTRSK
jgi:hypothetical protein